MRERRPVIGLIGALDTKGPEYAFVKKCVEEQDVSVLLIDVGVLGDATLPVDITADEVARAGGSSLGELRANQDRGEAQRVMSAGVAALVPELYANGRFDGVLALGGTGGTSVACAAMRALPLGVPKIMVSTVAGGDVSGYVGVKDIVMIPSIVDVSGLNRISRGVFAGAAAAACAMVKSRVESRAGGAGQESPANGEDRPLVAASMFGNTTPAVEAAKAIVEAEGYEVLVFHCTGAGGRTMESLIEAGMIAGVLDITTTEWADELVGGVFSAGPTRLQSAARGGVPAIVTPACLDMVNFWAPDTVPPQFNGRKFYQHNPNVTLMRTNVEENRRLGEIIAERLNESTAPITVLLPLGGVSMIDMPGKPFWWPEADQALFATLKANLRPDIPVIEMDCDVNAPEFAQRCAKELLVNMSTTAGTGKNRGEV